MIEQRTAVLAMSQLLGEASLAIFPPMLLDAFAYCRPVIPTGIIALSAQTQKTPGFCFCMQSISRHFMAAHPTILAGAFISNSASFFPIRRIR
jgi:hypothetical protein